MSRSANAPTVVVFDGDDTLWTTEPLYDEARQRARREVAAAGVDGAEWERLERATDVKNVTVMGFSVERFPTSCVQAYEAICAASDRPPRDDVRERVRNAALAVFTSDPPLIPGAMAALGALRRQGVQLALLTKGDFAVQQMRVAHSGIADRFETVRIVMDKTPAAFGELVEGLGGIPAHSWSVGNSMRSDILPALAAGLRAIWIEAHVWEHERFAHGALPAGVIEARTLQDVPDVICAHDTSHRRRRVPAAF